MLCRTMRRVLSSWTLLSELKCQHILYIRSLFLYVKQLQVRRSRALHEATTFFPEIKLHE